MNTDPDSWSLRSNGARQVVNKLYGAVQKVPCHVLWTVRDTYQRYKIQETRYTGHWRLRPLGSRHLGTSHSSPSHHLSPHCIFLNLIDNLKSLPFSMMLLDLGKAKSYRVPNLGCRGAESPGWFDISQKNSAQDVMHEWVHCRDEAANHQLPIAAALWIIWIVSVEEYSSLMQSLMQIHHSTRSAILDATATQYTQSLNAAYCPRWPAQWSGHCSRMCIPVHSPWLPGYISVVQTGLVILTMAGLFQTDLKCTKHRGEQVCVCVCVYNLSRRYPAMSYEK